MNQVEIDRNFATTTSNSEVVAEFHKLATFLAIRGTEGRALDNCLDRLFEAKEWACKAGLMVAPPLGKPPMRINDCRFLGIDPADCSMCGGAYCSTHRMEKCDCSPYERHIARGPQGRQEPYG